MGRIVIMLVRMIFVIELALGIWIASIKGLPYLKLHMALGFGVSLLLLLLAIVAAIRKLVLPVILGSIFAILLPYVGIKQFPIRFAPALGPIQYAHVAVALAAIGAAEFIHARTARSMKAAPPTGNEAANV